MSVDEKIGLTYEDIADVNMAYSLFDQDDQGKIDLESLETALQQICEGDDGSTIIPPIHRLRRYGDFVTLDSLVDETLVNHEDFDSGKGVRKIFRLFDVENKGWITRDNLFEAIDALSELSMM